MPYTNSELREMLNGCRANDRRCERMLFEWLKEFAANICFRYASHTIEVQDLVCDGFIKVFKNLHLYNEELYGCNEAAFKGWFKKVLINNCINYRNKFHPKIMYTEDALLMLAELEDDAEFVLDTMSYQEILNSITLLPPAYRMVFNLYVIDGYTHVEIADMLGITTGTSKSNLFKAKNRLRNELQKKMTVKKYV